jgi:hypothetical protein
MSEEIERSTATLTSERPAPYIKEADDSGFIRRADVEDGGTLIVPYYSLLHPGDVINVHANESLLPIAVLLVMPNDIGGPIEIKIPKYYFHGSSIAVYYVIIRLATVPVKSHQAEFQIVD